jgi:hypothetical protein
MFTTDNVLRNVYINNNNNVFNMYNTTTINSFRFENTLFHRVSGAFRPAQTVIFTETTWVYPSVPHVLSNGNVNYQVAPDGMDVTGLSICP